MGFRSCIKSCTNEHLSVLDIPYANQAAIIIHDMKILLIVLSAASVKKDLSFWKLLNLAVPNFFYFLVGFFYQDQYLNFDC